MVRVASHSRIELIRGRIAQHFIDEDADFLCILLDFLPLTLSRAGFFHGEAHADFRLIDAIEDALLTPAQTDILDFLAPTNA